MMFSIFCNVSPYMVLHKRPNSNLWSAVNSDRLNFSRTGTETICRVRLSFCPLLLLQGEIEQGNFSNLPSLHALACSIKVTEDSCNLMFQVVVTTESACHWFFHAIDQLKTTQLTHPTHFMQLVQVVVTSESARAIDQLRRACGGHGFMASSNLPCKGSVFLLFSQTHFKPSFSLEREVRRLHVFTYNPRKP